MHMHNSCSDRFRQWKNITSKRTSLPISRKNSTRNTTQHGTVSLDETSAATLLTKRNILSISTSDKLQFSYSDLAEQQFF